MSEANRTKLPITLKIGETQLSVTHFCLEHQLGRPFEASLELSAQDVALSPQGTIGKAATIEIILPTNTRRYLSGYVCRFAAKGKTPEGAWLYSATVVPGIWLLTRSSKSQIFQGKTCPEIIKEVLSSSPWSGLFQTEHHVGGTYDVRPMTVQYNESFFEFVSRLMEDQGMWYYFNQAKADGPHLYLCDSAASYTPFPMFDSIIFNARKGYLRGKDQIYSLDVEGNVVPNSVSLEDFDFQCAGTFPLRVTEKNAAVQEGPSYSEVQFPGAYNSVKVGKPAGPSLDPVGGVLLAKTRAEQFGNENLRIQGESNSLGLVVGHQIKVVSYPFPEGIEPTILITWQRMEVKPDGDSRTGYSCECRFSAIPTKIKGQGNALVDNDYRQPRRTEKPRISGFQTARVWAPKGADPRTPYCSTNNNAGQLAEPACNRLSCVHVAFPWDPNAASETVAPSPPVRVSQFSAAGRVGAMFMPLPNSEVLVAFEDGDPDRPVVAGRLYNSEQTPPVVLPAKATQSMIRDQWGNQIVFNEKTDKSGELPTILLQAGDQTKQNSSIEVGGPEGIIMTTKGNSSTFINGKKSEFIEGSQVKNYLGFVMSNYGGNKSQIVLGGETKFNGGWKMETYLGLKACYVFGAKCDWDYSKKAQFNTGYTLVDALAYTFTPISYTVKGAMAAYTWATSKKTVVNDEETLVNKTVVAVKEEEKIATKDEKIGLETSNIGVENETVGVRKLSGGSTIDNTATEVTTGAKFFS